VQSRQLELLFFPERPVKESSREHTSFLERPKEQQGAKQRGRRYAEVSLCIRAASTRGENGPSIISHRVKARSCKGEGSLQLYVTTYSKREAFP